MGSAGRWKGDGVGFGAMSDADRDAGEADLRFALVRSRYGDRLTAEQLDALRQLVQTLVDQVTALRAVPLVNADEPLQRFTPFRADE
jgi:hypothetical protein